MTMNDDAVKVIGLMSGTSLDGLDIAYVSFTSSDPLEYELLFCETISYSKEWKEKLSNAYHSNEDALKKLDAEYGIWLGNSVLHFMRAYQIKADLIASHGHTIFHKPNEVYTLQIGSGKIIRDLTRIPVINNFRAQDVRLGGQGAPLVPMGDELLFKQYDFCLNLGGFSNISWNANGKRMACDIGPCNILCNEICKKISIEYDEDGRFAKEGSVIERLLNKWNALDYYKVEAPKSLGREWFEIHFQKDIAQSDYDMKDLLATAVHHLVFQINKFVGEIIEHQVPEKSFYTILVTGGGAHNVHLIKKLQEMGGDKIKYIIPDKKWIDFKEAIVFALLGYLRWKNQINVLASVTGAKHDHSSGDIFK